jgi:lipoate-protein ligase A
MNAHRSIRLLSDAPLDGPSNMARDEALLIEVGRRASPPTLRLYEWDPPTVSLGYFQPIAAFERLPAPAGSLAVVRRLTGGGAILHDRELTYAWVLPDDHALLAGGPNRLYELAHQAIAAALRDLGPTATTAGVSDDSGPRRGPFFCFGRRHRFDLVVGEAKIAGSAQRRTRHAVLQHGSIVLDNRFPQQPSARVDGPTDDAAQRLRAGLRRAFAEVTRCDITAGTWTAPEGAVAADLIGKYAGVEWTGRV